MTRSRLAFGIVALGAYVSTIVLANWLITRFGAVDVGFGYKAPAGVFAAGLAFTLRDLTQDLLGRLAVVGAIVLGGLLSALVASTTTVAVASAVAFLVSEFLDFGVYTPLRERNWPVAVVASNVVGLVADSVLFLWLAFHSLAFLPGQVIGKTWVTLAFLPFLVLWRRQYRAAVLNQEPALA